MTAADVIRVAATVGAVQLACDWLADRWQYRKEPYARSVDAAARAAWTAAHEEEQLQRQANKGGKAGKGSGDGGKRLRRAQKAREQALARVAGLHTLPTVATAIVFIVLLRILGAEHGGKVLAVLPFKPFGLLRRLTARGLAFADGAAAETDAGTADPECACALMFLYLLSSLSVKAYVHKVCGRDPPPGADVAHREELLRRIGGDDEQGSKPSPSSKRE